MACLATTSSATRCSAWQHARRRCSCRSAATGAGTLNHPRSQLPADRFVAVYGSCAACSAHLSGSSSACDDGACSPRLQHTDVRRLCVFSDVMVRRGRCCRTIVTARLQRPEAVVLRGRHGEPPGFAYGDRCVFVSNDWHAALVPSYLAAKYRRHGVYQARQLMACIVSPCTAGHGQCASCGPYRGVCRKPTRAAHQHTPACCTVLLGCACRTRQRPQGSARVLRSAACSFDATCCEATMHGGRCSCGACRRRVACLRYTT